MQNKMFVVEFPSLGTAMVQVSYFLDIPIFGIQLLKADRPILVLFSNSNGEWVEDGVGVTATSDLIGQVLAQWLVTDT